MLLAVLKAHSSLTPSGDAHPDPCPIVITHNCDHGGSSEDTHGKAKQKEYNAAYYQRGSSDESGWHPTISTVDRAVALMLSVFRERDRATRWRRSLPKSGSVRNGTGSSIGYGGRPWRHTP